MATTAQVIVEAGMARSTSNDPGKLSGDGELLGRLARVYQTLYALAARQKPMMFESSVDLLLAGAPPTVALPTDCIDVRYIYNASNAKIHLIPANERHRTWHVPPRVFQLGTSLVSCGGASDPLAGDHMTAFVLDAPAALSALSTNLDARFPVRHHEILVNDLALYLDAKDDGRNPEQFAKLVSDQKAKLAAFASEYNLQASALEFVHAGSERVPAAAG